MKRNKALFIFVFIISFTQTNAQGLKRKYRGVYQGEIPTYELHFGDQQITVAPSNISIFLDKDSVYIEVGTYNYASTYSVINLSDKFEITVSRPNSGIPELLVLEKKTREIYRQGLYPQPDALLKRQGKLPRR